MTEHASLETTKKTPNSPSLRFTVSGQDYVETIQLVENDIATDCLTALHDNGSDIWPASPPWQELHIHEQSDGARVLLLVGRAGRSHWSMSVAIDTESAGIIFDVACRLHESPEFLGSTYRGTDLQSVEVTALRWDGLQIRPTTVVESRDDQIIVRPNSDVTAPVTLRWKYRITAAEFPSRS